MGMMGGGFLLMLLFPLLLLGLVALIAMTAGSAGWTLSRGTRAGTVGEAHCSAAPSFSNKSCPFCRRPLQADWQVCPYDGTRIE